MHAKLVYFDHACQISVFEIPTHKLAVDGTRYTECYQIKKYVILDALQTFSEETR